MPENLGGGVHCTWVEQIHAVVQKLNMVNLHQRQTWRRLCHNKTLIITTCNNCLHSFHWSVNSFSTVDNCCTYNLQYWLHKLWLFYFIVCTSLPSNQNFLKSQFLYKLTYRVGQKKVSQHNLHITSSDTCRFSKFFHYNILQEICNKTVIKCPNPP